MVSTSAFMGGALSFKGDKKKKKVKKKSQTVKHESATLPIPINDDMTEAERKAMRKQKERELQELEQVAKKSHRERVEEYNEKLGKLTEHNDIPRVSAAGNG